MLPALAERPTAKWADQARKVDLDIRKRAPELKPALVAPWVDHARLYKDEGGPWLVTPYDTDPLTQKDGGYPFPKDVKRVLSGLVARGVDFDDLAIAHELDPKGPAGALLGKIPSTGIAVDAHAAKELVGPLPATHATMQMASVMDKSTKLAGQGLRHAPKILAGAAIAPLALVALAPIALADGLDPIVFGVKHIEGDKKCASLWYPLAAWKW